MLTRMTGILTRVLDEEVRLQVGPFEYQVLVPEAVRRIIQMRTGEEMTLHISEYLEGNSGGNRFIPRRIGFLTESEVEFFDLFCTVEKIGVKKALKAMARPVKEIADAIARQDTRWLSTLPGIGATTAEQIVTTLKRKVMPFTVGESSDQASGGHEPHAGQADPKKRRGADAPRSPDGKVVDDLYQALMGLGLSPLESRNKLDSLLQSGKPFATVPEAIGLIFSARA